MKHATCECQNNEVILPSYRRRNTHYMKRTKKETAGYVSKKAGLPDRESKNILEEQIIKYSISARRRIFDELQSDKKSNEILGRFLGLTSIPGKILAEKVFEISPKTLHAYRYSNKTLPIRINEQILKLEELYKKGIEIFERPEHFDKWLKSESYGLGNTKPLEMINSITGIDLVYEELIRIEFGATA